MTNLYNNYLNSIQKQIGDGSTDNFTLETQCKKLFGKNFKGVFSADNIPKLTNAKNMCVYNLDKRGQTGSHWCSLWKDPKTGITYSYDSFARNLKKDRSFKNMNKMKRLLLKQAGDNESDQAIEESNCGARSIAWLCVCKDVENGKLDIQKMLKI